MSDDETPSIAGTSGTTKAGDWLEARGVSKAAFRTWMRSLNPRFLEDFDAESVYESERSCGTLTVGDKREDALVCSVGVRTSTMRYSAIAFVVRNKRLVTVLDVGFALPAMDWPDSRFLDLQLTFLPGGLEADLHDRAKPGAVLVAPPSRCREYFARYLACEKAHREGTASEQVCPLTMAASDKATIGHWPLTPPESPMGGGRIELQGCEVALAKLDQLFGDPKGPSDPELRDERAFAVKACKARGRFVWKGERFVRSAP